MTTIHFLNNTEETFVFTITGQAAEVIKVNAGGLIVKEKEITTRDQARDFFKLAKRFGCVDGSLIPATCTIYPEYAYVQDEADEPMPFGVL